jgi:Na+/melibiose symporter-like transporter
MAERLSKSLLYAYGVADLFFNTMISMEAYFFAAFLTDYAQFPLVLAGQILHLTSIIDIVFALAGGIVLQKVTLRYGGKYRSWFLVGPPLVAPLFILQFTKMGGNIGAPLIVIFGFIASHLLFNVVVSATGGMLGRLSQLPEERTILSTSRAQGMSAGQILFSATAMPMIAYFGAHTNKIAGFTLTVAIYALLMVLGYWFIYWRTAGKDPYDEAMPQASGMKSSLTVKEIIRLVLHNPPLIFLILAQVFSSTSFFIITAMAIYYFTYVSGNAAFLSIFLLSISIARLIGTFAAAWIGVKIGKRHSYWLFFVLAAIGFACTRFLNHFIWGFTLMFSLSVLFVSVSTSMNTALFADTVVYGEWKTGSNIRAFTMALMNLPIKMGVLIRSAVVTVGLIAIGFVANTAPTPRVTGGISSIMSFGPAIGYAFAAIIFFFGYKLDETDITEMQAQITAKKNSAGI